MAAAFPRHQTGRCRARHQKNTGRKNKAHLNELLKNSKTYTWENLLQPLEDMNDRLSYAWSPVSHLHSVMQSDELRDVYNICLPLITEYSTLFMQYEPLYKAIEQIAKSENYTKLDAAQKKAIANELRDFRLYGVHLSADKKEQFLELEKQVSKLTTRFSENVLDATQNWFFHITDKKQLAGMPESACELAEKNAKERSQPGWVLTLGLSKLFCSNEIFR